MSSSFVSPQPRWRPGVFVAFVLSLLAAHAAATSLWSWLTDAPHRLWVHWLLISLGLTALFAVTRILARRPYSGETLPWWTVPLALFGGQWFAMSTHVLIEHAAEDVPHLHLVIALVAATLLLVCRKWLHAVTHEHGHVKNVLADPPEDTPEAAALPEPHVLVCLVSPPVGTTLVFASNHAHRPCVVTSREGSVTLEPVTEQGQALNERLRTDIDALTPLKINWQQLLRVFRESDVQNLPRVIFVGEKKEWLEQAIRWTKPYLPNASFDIEVVARLDDVNLLYNALNHLVHRLGEQPERVIVDVTGGFAISSIAASALTIRDKTRIQWVPTFDAAKRDAHNRAYDLRSILRPLPEH